MAGNSEPLLVLLNDSRPGHWRQVRALADRLSSRQHVIDVALHLPWRVVAPRSLPFGLRAHPRLVRSLPAEPPLAVLSCGRRSALVLRWLQRYWAGLPGTVQILDCGIAPAHFDFVIVPRHDGLAGRNVIRTLGSLNPVDDAWLEQARSDAAASADPGPQVVLLLGGPARHFRMTRAWLRASLRPLSAVIRNTGARFTVVGSPRTPGWACREAEKCATELAGTFIGWRDEPFPAAAYPATLAAASHLVVTADSVNLMSEACATGRPVCLLGAERVRGRVKAFVDALQAQGYALGVGGLPAAIAGERRTRVLRETAAVAVRLRRSGLLG